MRFAFASPMYFLTIRATPPGLLLPGQHLRSTCTVLCKLSPSVSLGQRHGPAAGPLCEVSTNEQEKN